MTWDAIREAQETVQIYNARRTAIYAQYDKALLSQDRDSVLSVEKAVADYNRQVIQLDPTMAIKADQLRGSLQQRQRARGMMEQTLSKNRREVPVTNRVLDQFPGVRIERVK